MAVEPIDDLGDQRLAPYMGLKDRELARDGKRFIVESEQVVRRLLASRYEAESVLVARRKLESLRAAVSESVPLYVVPDAMIHRVVGYRFHSGVMAVGKRKPLPTVEDVLRDVDGMGTITLIVCPETNNTENLGMMIRIAAGFGATAMILGEHCCDPFYRQAIRVSMGSVFSLPIVQSRDVKKDLLELKEKWGFGLVATVLDANAEALESACRSRRLALLFGGEGQGLSEEIISMCDRRVTIPMKHGTDSLNVAVAAGVFLYHFTCREATR